MLEGEALFRGGSAMKRTTKHRPMLIGLISSLSLAAAFLVACGDDSDSSTTPSSATVATTAPQYVVPGGAALTERQRVMVSVVERYVAAWQATDGEGVASFMTADGYIQYPEDNMTYLVSDGTLQTRVTNGPYSTLHALAPMTVYDNWIVLSGRIDSLTMNWLSVVRFTSSGDVRIISESIFH
jgi:hypothetical protein